MHRCFRGLLVTGIGLAMGVYASASRAQDAPSAAGVIVVDVSPGAVSLDPDALRAQIAQELRARVVRPGEPGAATAKGTLTVDVDRKGGQLSVSYLANATPTTRRVALPGDDAATRAAAVSLAGNLARDEASELAAELRGHVASSPSPPPAPVAPSADDAATSDDKDMVRLRGTLDYYTRRDHTSRVAFGWTAVVVGAGALVGASELAAQPGNYAWGIALPASGFLFGLGLGQLLFSSPFEDLDVLAQQGGDPAQTEAAWLNDARRERRARNVGGFFEIVLGGLSLAVGTLFLADANLVTASDRVNISAEWYALGALSLAYGVYMVATEGPLETGLRAYEASSGRTVWPKEASLVDHLRVAPAPGGGMASFSMTF
jgi:hypothetical protein